MQLIKITNAKSSCKNAKIVTLTSAIVMELQEMQNPTQPFSAVERECTKLGLVINEGKTKYCVNN